MTVFTTALKRIVRQPINWAFILLFPVVFAVLITASSGASESDATSIDMYFGVIDQDNTTVSQTLVKQMGLRYNVIDIANEEDISAALTESDVPWVLLIREGYERDVLAGRTPALEGYSLTVSDMSSLGNVTAQNITRALMLLGTNDDAALSAWEESSRVEVTALETYDNWGLIAFWFGFFGFVSLFTAYFIIKTLTDDKRHGMPDRIGVLPISTRGYLVQGMLAAFCTTEITAGLLMLALRLLLGTIPNAPFLFIILSLYNLFSVGMVFAIVSLSKDLGVASVSITMFATIFSMLGGLFWPLEFAPEFMKKLAWFSPGYWLARGLENIQDITFEGFGMPILFLLGFTVVVILLGGWKRIQPMED